MTRGRRFLFLAVIFSAAYGAAPALARHYEYGYGGVSHGYLAPDSFGTPGYSVSGAGAYTASGAGAYTASGAGAYSVPGAPPAGQYRQNLNTSAPMCVPGTMCVPGDNSDYWVTGGRAYK